MKILYAWVYCINEIQNDLPLIHYSAQVQFSWFWDSNEREYNKSLIQQWKKHKKVISRHLY